MADLTAKTKSPSAALLWYVLFVLADGKKGTVRGASITRLAKLTGLDRKTTRKAVCKLLEADAIARLTDSAVPIYSLVHVEVERP